MTNSTADSPESGGVASSPSASFLKGIMHDMIFYRRFEERVLAAYTRQKFSGFCHLHIGQEGLCVGVQKAIKNHDYVLSSYRSHTQAIAKGIPARSVLAELFGKATGCSGGKGGSMHMFSHKHRFYGGHGIVGGQVPVAVGIGWKIRYSSEQDVVICYLGDGAMNQGQVYESFNLACLWKLPVLFVIENNLYGMGTHIDRTTTLGGKNLHKKALAFNMDHSQVNGQDALAVYNHVKDIVTAMRTKQKPHLLEAHTYRYKGHSVSDPSLYRTKKEVEKYMSHDDPILNLTTKLTAEGVATSEEIAQWDREIKAELKALEASVDNDPEPELEAAYRDV